MRLRWTIFGGIQENEEGDKDMDYDCEDEQPTECSSSIVVPRHPSSYSQLPESCQLTSIDELINKVSNMSMQGTTKICDDGGCWGNEWVRRMELLTTRDLLDLFRQAVTKSGIWLWQVTNLYSE